MSEQPTALERYGQHQFLCPARGFWVWSLRQRVIGACTCGFDGAILAERQIQADMAQLRARITEMLREPHTSNEWASEVRKLVTLPLQSFDAPSESQF